MGTTLHTEPLHIQHWILFFILIFAAQCSADSKTYSKDHRYIKAQKAYPVVLKQSLNSLSKDNKDTLNRQDDSLATNLTVVSLTHEDFQSTGLDREVATLTDEAGDARYIIIDSGNTDVIGITEFFIYFGAVGLAVLCAVAILGLILGILDTIKSAPSTHATTYSSYGSPHTDTYS